MNKRFRVGRQEDSHEFLRELIDHMQSAEFGFPKKLDRESKLASAIGRIFAGLMRSSVACQRCRYVSVTKEIFYDISLDIQRSSTLENALGNFFAKETLCKDNSYKCDKCHRMSRATKQFAIEQSKVLCVICSS